MPEEGRWLDLELEAYSDKNICPMHMPGHKRKSQIEFQRTPFFYDITEIEGFDNLHRPVGLIKELEERINDLFGLETLPEVTSDLAKGFPDWDLDISMIEVDSEQ